MKIARLLRIGLAGPEPRTVVVQPQLDCAIDVQRAEQGRLEALGSTPEAALRLAEARFPGSLAAALGSASFQADLQQAVSVEPAPDAVVPLAEAHWLAPLDPPRFRDFMSFEVHHIVVRRRLGRPVPPVTYELPTYYKASHLGLVGHNATIEWPGYSTWMDYELELGYVVGRGGVDLTPSEAETCLFGVTLLNDFSARDRQFHEATGNLGPAKGKDFATALGPWITTLDEFADFNAIELTAEINGETWASARAGSAMWSPAELLAYVSTAEPLVPGELIGSGTVGGGCALEVGRQLTHGDIIELRGSELGVLRTTIGSTGTVRWAPTARVPGSTIDGGTVDADDIVVMPPRLDAPAPPLKS